MEDVIPQDIYSSQGPCLPQKIFLVVATAACVALAWWLLMGGVETVARGFGWHPQLGDPVRRRCLGAALTIYFARLILTQFVFLRRALRWTEAATIGGWLFVIYLVFAMCGGTNPTPANGRLAAGLIFFLFGSWMNTYAEYQRHRWKQDVQNHNRLYTQGLFRYTRHPNYLGDLLSFSGMCLIAGCWACAAIPGIMLAGFVFVNIPMLDAHLHEHYGRAFDEYAKRTRRLVPFVY